MASKASNEDLKEEIEFFNMIDTNKDGYITKKELKAGLKNYPHIDKELLNSMVKSIDTEHNGAIAFNEFIAAIMNDSITKDYNKISKAFKFFDKDDNGAIDDRELKQALAGSEFKHIETQIFTDVINECNGSKDGEIQMKDFMRLMSVRFENSFQTTMQMSTIEE